MATGKYNGKTVDAPEIRNMFNRDDLLASDWYKKRLTVKQERDVILWSGHVRYLETFLKLQSHQDVSETLDIEARLEAAKDKLQQVGSSDYLTQLVGTLGADPMMPA